MCRKLCPSHILFAITLAALSIAVSFSWANQHRNSTTDSGLPVGESLRAFTPVHVTGADKNTHSGNQVRQLHCR